MTDSFPPFTAVPFGTSGCDRDRWGVNVELQLETWFRDVFLPMFHARFDATSRRETGRDAEIAVVILDPASSHDWHSPLDHIAHLLRSDETVERLDRFFGVEGILANIVGKLAFSIRTKLDSLFAQQRPDLLEPGDFPHQGAGYYKGYCGGVSGLPKGSDDWWCFKQIIAELIRLRAAAVQPALADSKARRLGLKYLGSNHYLRLLRRIIPSLSDYRGA